jgi:16S rRNA (cytosine967-C5)-methyltransferase
MKSIAVTQATPHPTRKRNAPLTFPLSADILDGCALAWSNVLDGRRSADRALTRTLYSLKTLSRPQRNFVAQTVLDMLRVRALIQAQQSLISRPASPRHPVYLYLLGHAQLTPRDLAPQDEEIRFVQDALAQWTSHEQSLTAHERLALHASLPLWLIERLIAIYGEEATRALTSASRQPPPVTLRVNTLKAPDREALRARLCSEEDIHPEPCSLSPLALTLAPHTRVMFSNAFREGWFEIQDEGSQLLGLLCGVKPGDKVVDACAGAGGKTLLLAAQMQNKGTLWALDAYAHRLEELKPRARRAGVHNTHIEAIEGQDGKHRLDRLRGQADVVLIDAPCSGTGSLRRNPDGADRLTPERLASLAKLQGEILDQYAQLVRPGGRLVYATCSVLPDENQQVVAAFLARTPYFTQIDPRPILAAAGARFPTPHDGSNFFYTLPHLHGTDGFFGAVFVRDEAVPKDAPQDAP